MADPQRCSLQEEEEEEEEEEEGEGVCLRVMAETVACAPDSQEGGRGCRGCQERSLLLLLLVMRRRSVGTGRQGKTEAAWGAVAASWGESASLQYSDSSSPSLAPCACGSSPSVG